VEFPAADVGLEDRAGVGLRNTVVLKPAEFTSLTALYFAELCQEAGCRPAWSISLPARARLVKRWSIIPASPRLHLPDRRTSTHHPRAHRRERQKLSLELGGKSPFLVLEDADLDAAVEGLVDAICSTKARCVAPDRGCWSRRAGRTIPHEIKARLANFRLGDPLDKCIDMGAVVDPIQRTRIDQLVCQAESEGGRVWRAPVNCPPTGCYYPPTLITHLGTANTAWREEIFGPVLAVITFRSVSEAIQLANNTRFGLSATIWSENINRALELAGAVKAGVVWVNCTNQFDAACPFGGYKESGFGREGGLLGWTSISRPSESGSTTVRCACLLPPSLPGRLAPAS